MASFLRLSLAGRRLTARLALWLMLAVVASHAVVPAAAPLERIRGSAFSAATIDVSTTAQRVEVAADPVVHLPGGAGRVIAAPPVASFPYIARRADFAARAPPVRGLLSTILPSGPPVA